MSVYFNTALGTIFIITLIFLDYIRKYNTDAFLRTVFISVLAAAFLATLTDFLNRILGGLPGRGITITLYIVNSLFYIFQIITYYMAAVFIDYFAYNDEARSRRLIWYVGLFTALFSLSVVYNLILHFYFYIDEGNRYTYGGWYFIRLILDYLSIPIIIVDLCFSSKKANPSQFYLIAFFGILTGAGAALDMIVKPGSLAWPCFAAALLYLYFFIIRSDSKIDSLTGIGNRLAFNEFIEKLSRRNIKELLLKERRFGSSASRNRQGRESWAVVMIDMDHFKQINDVLGHLEGDNALKDMAAVIKGCIRYTDFAARYGGDEFVVATRCETDVESLISRLRASLASHNEKAGRPYKLEISYGYGIFTTGGGQSINDFLAHIDSQMYKHKAERRRASDLHNERLSTKPVTRGTAHE
jgi:diguanylate cyclase (GGDEF)-like protein